jgi:hypothetical protein
MSEIMYNDSNLQMNSELILCIKDYDNTKDKSSIDTIMFIGWSYIDNVYYVRGKRQDICDSQFVPYALKCENINELYNFIEFTLGYRNRLSIILYNFNNICDMVSNDITYEFLEEHIDKNYEISGYDNIKLNRLEVIKSLRLLKHTFN